MFTVGCKLDSLIENFLCMQVINKGTGAQAPVRIVDQCSNGGLDLDVGVVRQLNTDGRCNAQGHLMVNY